MAHEDDGMYCNGNNSNMLWPLMFMFNRGFGGWGGGGGDCGGGGYGRGYGGGYGGYGYAPCGPSVVTCEPAAATTAKDVAQQMNAFQHWASENSSVIQQAINGVDKGVCHSTRDIIEAVNSLTPQMFQSFASLTQGMNTGFASQQLASCQSTADIKTALCDGFSAASRQGADETARLTQAMCNGFKDMELSNQRGTLELGNLAERGFHRVETQNLSDFAKVTAQADRIAMQNSLQAQAQNNALNLQLLANANTAAMAACDMKNQLAACCCEIKSTVTEDGQKTRALITDNEMASLRMKLSDTKDKLANSEQSILVSQQIQGAVGTILHHLPLCQPVTPPGPPGPPR